LDDLLLVHLLDKLEQRTADDVFALVDAVEAALVQADQEFDGFLVARVGGVEVELREVLLCCFAFGLHELFAFALRQLYFQTLFYDFLQLILFYHLLPLLELELLVEVEFFEILEDSLLALLREIVH